MQLGTSPSRVILNYQYRELYLKALTNAIFQSFKPSIIHHGHNSSRISSCLFEPEEQKKHSFQLATSSSDQQNPFLIEAQPPAPFSQPLRFFKQGKKLAKGFLPVHQGIIYPETSSSYLKIAYDPDSLLASAFRATSPETSPLELPDSAPCDGTFVPVSCPRLFLALYHLAQS